jgi:hypothetical protein
MQYPIARHPYENEICTICPKRDHKRAALLYDRIFIPPGDFDFLDTPVELTFGDNRGDNLGDNGLSNWQLWFEYGLNVYTATNRGMLAYDKYVAMCYPSLSVVSGFKSEPFDSDGKPVHFYLNNSETEVPVADASSLPKLPKQIDTFTAVISNLPLVDDNTGWDEILEFRRDKISVSKSRRFRMWLREASRATSETQVEDLISQMLDDYSTALKKHSIKTAASGLTLVAAAGGAALAAGSAGTVVAALSAGVGITSGAIAWILKQRCDEDDVRRGKGSEIAVIYDAVERFGGNSDEKK